AECKANHVRPRNSIQMHAGGTEMVAAGDAGKSDGERPCSADAFLDSKLAGRECQPFVGIYEHARTMGSQDGWTGISVYTATAYMRSVLPNPRQAMGTQALHFRRHQRLCCAASHFSGCTRCEECLRDAFRKGINLVNCHVRSCIR